MNRAILDRIVRALSPLEAVRVAYVFGSTVSGTSRPDSDLDLAVALDVTLVARAKHRTLLAIVGALTDELGALGERVDVTDLAEADPAVAFKAIQGERVLSRDERERRLLEVLIARRYDDDAPRRALYRRAARARWGAT